MGDILPPYVYRGPPSGPSPKRLRNNRATSSPSSQKPLDKAVTDASLSNIEPSISPQKPPKSLTTHGCSFDKKPPKDSFPVRISNYVTGILGMFKSDTSEKDSSRTEGGQIDSPPNHVGDSLDDAQAFQKVLNSNLESILYGGSLETPVTRPILMKDKMQHTGNEQVDSSYHKDPRDFLGKTEVSKVKVIHDQENLERYLFFPQITPEDRPSTELDKGLSEATLAAEASLEDTKKGKTVELLTSMCGADNIAFSNVAERAINIQIPGKTRPVDETFVRKHFNDFIQDTEKAAQ